MPSKSQVDHNHHERICLDTALVIKPELGNDSLGLFWSVEVVVEGIDGVIVVPRSQSYGGLDVLKYSRSW